MLGAGDAVIGINPATDNPERAHALLSMLDEIRAKLDIPTQTCVLAHITTTLNLMRRGSPIDLAIAGTEAANRSFGISWQCSERLARRHCRFGGDPSVTMSCISKLAKAAHSRRTPITGSTNRRPTAYVVIGVLSILGPDDPEGKARTTVFEQALQQLGWVVGRNLKIETREVGSDLDRLRRYAAELVALAPDVIFSIGSSSIAPLQQATRTIPIVFVSVADPVGAGFVQSMSHPGGNVTGFSNFEYSMSGKWAELLKQT